MVDLKVAYKGASKGPGKSKAVRSMFVHIGNQSRKESQKQVKLDRSNATKMGVAMAWLLVQRAIVSSRRKVLTLKAAWVKYIDAVNLLPSNDREFYYPRSPYEFGVVANIVHWKEMNTKDKYYDIYSTMHDYERHFGQLWRKAGFLREMGPGMEGDKYPILREFYEQDNEPMMEHLVEFAERVYRDGHGFTGEQAWGLDDDPTDLDEMIADAVGSYFDSNPSATIEHDQTLSDIYEINQQAEPVGPLEIVSGSLIAAGFHLANDEEDGQIPIYSLGDEDEDLMLEHLLDAMDVGDFLGDDTVRHGFSQYEKGNTVVTIINLHEYRIGNRSVTDALVDIITYIDEEYANQDGPAVLDAGFVVYDPEIDGETLMADEMVAYIQYDTEEQY
jgi:hypothetical protein